MYKPILVICNPTNMTLYAETKCTKGCIAENWCYYRERQAEIACRLYTRIDELDEDGTFTVRPLPWRSDKITGILHGLDNKHDKRRSKRSKLMTFERVYGPISDRVIPSNTSIPSWCVNN